VDRLNLWINRVLLSLFDRRLAIFRMSSLVSNFLGSAMVPSLNPNNFTEFPNGLTTF
jgi:hypothetical protein